MTLDIQEHVPHIQAGEAAGLAVSVHPGEDTATVILSAPSVQMTAAECMAAIRLLAEAAAALATHAPPSP